MNEVVAMSLILLGAYRHYKGNEYEVIGFAKHSETLEDISVSSVCVTTPHSK